MSPFDAPEVEAVQYDLAAEMSETGGQTKKMHYAKWDRKWDAT